MLPCTTKLADLPFKPKGIVLSGGPSSVYDQGAPHVDPTVFDLLGVLILGICYGCQELAWRINSKNVAVITSTKNSEYAATAHQTKPIYGVQFHPELEHTPKGSEILRNFSVMSNFIRKEIVRIRHLVGDRAQVIGAVKETLQKHLGINLTVINGAKLFLSRLKGVTEPEKKRKIIGGTFIDLFEKEALRIEKEAENTPNAGAVEWFLQGTLYPDVPDVIESLSFKGPSATIKTHHNVGGLPDTLKLKLIEPLRELFKDKVRSFGRELSIHRDLIMRHLFPGPGIAIRILGEVTLERVAIAQAANNIFISMIKEASIYDQMSQSYAGLDTNRAVGVQGDARVYGYIVILRAEDAFCGFGGPATEERRPLWTVCIQLSMSCVCPFISRQESVRERGRQCVRSSD
ncbi:adenine nucleotide alpha hydrolases-like protein [Colletotrichum falcatum]|nr:adenine nucleotide alpha hydrolases-like protein [Colletotrichum falcatum]